jgi:hypothetical protein
MREELEGAVKSLELSIPQRDLLSLELNAPVIDTNAPDEPKPALTDEIYEQARREAERRYQIAMVEWLEIAVAEATRAESPPLDVRSVLKETWSKAWKGDKPDTNLDTRARVPGELMMKLIEACEEFLKAELHAYLRLLERSGVPASQRLIRLERELDRILFETRTRKWSRAIKERMPAGFFQNDERSLMQSWRIVEDAIKKFIHDDLEFDFWISDLGLSKQKPSEQRTQEDIRDDSESISVQLNRYREECRFTVEELAEAVSIEPRSVYRHLSGESEPRLRQIGAYERTFSDRLGKKVVIHKTSGKRQ